MKRLNLRRILCGLFFLALAGFSCFWTAESLFIWRPSITMVGALLIAIAFYVVASLCFSKMLTAFDRNADFYGKLGGRGGQLTIGIIGLIIFWSISLATNTHTLLYDAAIRPILITDIDRTKGYLQEMNSDKGNVMIRAIDEKYEAKKKAVDALIERLKAEIKNPSALGIGHRFETILVELDMILFEDQQNKIQRVANVGSNETQWLKAINHYQRQAQDQLALYRRACDMEKAEIRRTMDAHNELNNIIHNLEIAKKDVTEMHRINNDIISAADHDLVNGYAFIKTHTKYVDLKPEDEVRYTREGAIPEAEEMKSVYDVWKDYLTTDKYNGHGFIWWVLIALLVDLSAFIFFDKTIKE